MTICKPQTQALGQSESSASRCRGSALGSRRRPPTLAPPNVPAFSGEARWRRCRSLPRGRSGRRRSAHDEGAASSAARTRWTAPACQRGAMRCSLARPSHGRGTRFGIGNHVHACAGVGAAGGRGGGGAPEPDPCGPDMAAAVVPRKLPNASINASTANDEAMSSSGSGTTTIVSACGRSVPHTYARPG